MKKNLLNLSVAVGVIAAVLMVNHLILAWDPPTKTPPQENAAAPINIGSEGQYKAGKMGVATNGLDNNYGLTVGNSTNKLGVKASGDSYFEGIVNAAKNIKAGTGYIMAGKIGPKNSSDYLTGDVAGTRVCIAGNCREGWPDAPLSDLNEYSAGHEIPMSEHPYPYTTDSLYIHPYLKFLTIYDNPKFGPSSENEYATNWFVMGYNYRQPYEQTRVASYIEEGDNSIPADIYWIGGSWPDKTTRHPADAFLWCCHHPKGVQVCYNGQQNESYCKSLSDADGKYLVYQDSASATHGRIVLQTRVTSAVKACQDKPYLPGIIAASWGRPGVMNFRITNYQLPCASSSNNSNDPCYDPDYEANDVCYHGNTHSVIQGRFLVTKYGQFNPSPIKNFAEQARNLNTNIYTSGERHVNPTYVIKSLGISYLKFIQ